jgi:RHS repeat-associated protein
MARQVESAASMATSRWWLTEIHVTSNSHDFDTHVTSAAAAEAHGSDAPPAARHDVARLLPHQRPFRNAVAHRRVSGTTLQSTDYYVAENLGSTTALLTSGSVARSWAYDPDGTPTSSGSGASTDILFAGGQTLTNGLTRFYNPAIGRWTQADALQQISDLIQANRYIYVKSAPGESLHEASSASSAVGSLVKAGYTDT